MWAFAKTFAAPVRLHERNRAAGRSGVSRDYKYIIKRISAEKKEKGMRRWQSIKLNFNTLVGLLFMCSACRGFAWLAFYCHNNKNSGLEF